MFYYALLIITIVIAATTWLAGGALRRYLFDRRCKQAWRQFEQRRHGLEAEFFQAAAASGKPRGLIWKQCDFHDGALFALDRVSREFYALVGVTIQFEAIEGGGMEDVEAVSNLRCATAVFIQRKRDWETDGRAVFNLEPHEALQRYRDVLEPLAA